MNIPYFLHEGEVARMERIKRRLIILDVIVGALLILSNSAWFFLIFFK